MSSDETSSRLLTKFASNLRRARLEKGMSASDLARAIWGTTQDSNGHTVARNRDRISIWERAKAFPTDEHLQEVAKALGMTVEDLAPERSMASIERSAPEFQMHMIPGGENRVILRLNTITSLETATEIAGLLARDKRSTPVTDSERELLRG